MNFNVILSAIKNTIIPPVHSPIPQGADPAISSHGPPPGKYDPTNDLAAVRQYRPGYSGSNGDVMHLIQKYGRDAVMSGIDAEKAKPTPTPIPQAVSSVLGASTNIHDNRPIPAGIDVAMNFIKSQTPQGQSPEQYYPALGDKQFMLKVMDADKIRQGVANLLLSQGFLESTLGRASNNIFGTKPNGQVSQFNSPADSLDYQLSPNVLGGGANPNMNILNEADKSPLTFDRILQLYKSYDPPGAYVNTLRKIFSN